MRLWMICYDISDTSRRRRIVAALSDAGAQRVQESVFEGWFLHRDLASLIAEISPLVREDGGSLRIYPILTSIAGRNAFGLMPAKADQVRNWQC